MFNLVALPVSRGMMEKYQNKRIRQPRITITEESGYGDSNTNYRNEYDRTRGELSRYRITDSRRVKKSCRTFFFR